jgi:hypothetical protein
LIVVWANGTGNVSNFNNVPYKSTIYISISVEVFSFFRKAL